MRTYTPEGLDVFVARCRLFLLPDSGWAYIALAVIVLRYLFLLYLIYLLGIKAFS